MRKRWFVVALLLALVLVACGGDGDAEPATATPSATPFTPTSLPPTWTATPEGFVASKTPTPAAEEAADDESAGNSQSSGQLGDGQEFPPTWTPGSPPTRTSRPRPTQGPDTSSGSTNIITKSPAPTWTPLPDECYELQSLVEDMAIYTGMSAVVSWTPVPGYDNYLIEVRHPGGGVTHGTFVKGTSYEIPAEVFGNVAGAYGWEVWAVEPDGQRVCFPISGEIVVSFPEPGN